MTCEPCRDRISHNQNLDGGLDMKQYIEVDAKRLAELVLVADLDDCIDFAEEWDEDFDDKYDASGWHGIKRVDLFNEAYYGAVAIGMWGRGGWSENLRHISR